MGEKMRDHEKTKVETKIWTIKLKEVKGGSSQQKLWEEIELIVFLHFHQETVLLTSWI